jgi:uncharacterized protein DUF5658
VNFVSSISARLSQPIAIAAPIEIAVPADGLRDRATRVLAVLSLIWVLNFFDLSYTVLESSGRHFRELNPVAAALLESPIALVAYKAALVAVGSTILLLYRNVRVVEWGSWLVLAAYVWVAIRWSLYFADLAVCATDPVISREPLLSCALP